MKSYRQGILGHIRCWVEWEKSLPAGPSVTAKIHPVFHVSQLKKAVGDKHQVYADIALINDQMELVLEPENVTQLRWNEAERDWE